MLIQYAAVVPAYPLPTITISVSIGSSLLDLKLRKGELASSIQYDFVGSETGRTIFNCSELDSLSVGNEEDLTIVLTCS